MLLRVTTRSLARAVLMCTVKVGLTFSATEVWSAVMVTSTRSPWLPVPGVPEPGSSVTAVLTGVLSRVSCSNLPTSAPVTDWMAFTTGALVPV
ncbi:hypothetical protein D3C80_1299850 [compost metagenome]